MVEELQPSIERRIPRAGLSSARPARDAGGMRLWVLSTAGRLRRLAADRSTCAAARQRVG
jgi:hypothetical protein